MNTMNERNRILWQLALLFIIAAFLLFLMDWQMLAGPSEPHQRLAGLSLAVMAGLFAAAGYLVSGQVGELSGERERLQQQLSAITSELEATRSNLEQRVERRTFEISVANASPARSPSASRPRPRPSESSGGWSLSFSPPAMAFLGWTWKATSPLSTRPPP